MREAWPLVGRAEELRLLEQVLGTPPGTPTAPAGSAVLVGRSGVGKTRLATEAVGVAAARGHPTEWVRAAQGAATIAFSPFAHLLPGPDQCDPGDEHIDLFRRVERALVVRTGAGGRRLVLAVDDAHLLDQASAALIHHLAATHAVSVVITARSGEKTPDPIVALWKDGLAERIDVGELREPEVDELLGLVLGHVDGGARSRLWWASQGNVLYLRELVRGGLASGALRREDGVWTWQGPLIAPRLSELVERRLDEVGAEVRTAAQVLALAEPVSIRLLASVVGREAVEQAEAQGLVVAVVDGQRVVARLAHPLYGEVLRTRLPRLRSETLYRQLADAMTGLGLRRKDDRLRLATWQLDAGVAVDTEVLVAAARAAHAALDIMLTERLARAAVGAGGGALVWAALGSALEWQGRHRDAEEAFARATETADDDETRYRVAVDRAPNLFFGLGLPAEAEAVLRATERAIALDDRRDAVNALRAQFLLFSGHTVDALAVARSVIDRPGADAKHVVRAQACAAPAMAAMGHTAAALAVVDRAWAVALTSAEEMPRALGQLFGARIAAACLAGDIVEAARVGDRLYRLALDERDDGVRAGAAGALGQAMLGAGQVATALRWFREAVALLRHYDPTGYFPWCLAGVAHAAALLGELDEARSALAEARSVHSPGSRVFDVELARAEVWIAAATGTYSNAVRLAVAAANRAASMGHRATEVMALHDAVRLGAADDVVERLAEVAAAVDGALSRVYAEHGRAAAEADAFALDEVSREFEARGAVLLAAEAAADAARSHRRAGEGRCAVAAEARAGVLARRCEGARTPALAGLGAYGPATLTRRQREIAALAARGLTSREIAERLTVSIRTVDNHLHEVYAKLGVHRRQELASLLSAGTAGVSQIAWPLVGSHMTVFDNLTLALPSDDDSDADFRGRVEGDAASKASAPTPVQHRGPRLRGR